MEVATTTTSGSKRMDQQSTNRFLPDGPPLCVVVPNICQLTIAWLTATILLIKVYTLTGSIKIGNSSDTYPPSTTVVLTSQVDEDGVQLTAAHTVEGEETRFVLIAGEPLAQPVVQHGPFVMTSRQEIIQAL